MELVSINLYSIYSPPFKIDFTEFINCPVCDFEIDFLNKEVDVNTIICCEICNQKLNIKFVKIEK
jgi:hypothetical protein